MMPVLAYPAQCRTALTKDADRTTPRRFAQQPGVWLVVACCLFNLALCFLDTRHWVHATSGIVIATEMALLAIGFYLIRRELATLFVRVSLLLVLYMGSAKLVNPGVDLKLVHDIAIMYIFYELGRQTSARIGSRLLWTVMVIVLAVGVFELLLTGIFGQVFDVWSYYVNKGALSGDTVNYSNTNLFLSANRGAGMGRTFLPSLLGSHRVSSIFLEPDSMGNFAAIAFAWMLSAEWETRGRKITLLILSLSCVVLADSRFATGCCIIMLLVRYSMLYRSRLVVFALPLLVMAALYVDGWTNELAGVIPGIMSDDLTGRLLFSGRLLFYWTLPNWFAVQASPVYVADTGFAYFINSVGLPLTLLLLFQFAWQRPRSRCSKIMKAMISVYFATSLCIGASVFTIKTAALLWFLYGTLYSAEPTGRAVARVSERIGFPLRPAAAFR